MELQYVLFILYILLYRKIYSYICYTDITNTVTAFYQPVHLKNLGMRGTYLLLDLAGKSKFCFINIPGNTLNIWK